MHTLNPFYSISGFNIRNHKWSCRLYERMYCCPIDTNTDTWNRLLVRTSRSREKIETFELFEIQLLVVTADTQNKNKFFHLISR